MISREFLKKAVNRELPVQLAFRELVRARRGEFPFLARQYLDGISKITGLPKEKIARSGPFLEYLRKLRM